MATTIGQRLAQRTSHRAAGLAAAAAAVVLACGLGLAVFVSQASVTMSGAEDRAVSQVHGTGRGFQADLGSYTSSMVAATSQASGYAAGKGGLMEYADLELSAAGRIISQSRGGVLESAEVR